MDATTLIFLAIAAASLVLAGFAWLRASTHKARLGQAERNAAETARILETAHREHAESGRAHSEAETAAAVLRQKLDDAAVRVSEREAVIARTEALHRAAADAASAARSEIQADLARRETELAVARQQLEEMQARISDWDVTRARFLESTQAAVLATAQSLSTKLLADHKQETELARKETETIAARATQQLAAQVGQMTDQVAQLKGQVAQENDRLESVWQALTSPGAAGHFAEIGLANTLKSFGLVQDRDFLLQHSLWGEEGERRLRPDAVIHLPGDSVMVIDAKASKFILDIAEASNEAEVAAARANLARTMNGHLKSLAEKDYRAAVQAALRKSGRPGEIARTMTVMYVPNDGLLEKLHAADPGFAQKACQAQIIPAGPAGLACALAFAAVEISLMRQAENQDRIVQTAEALLDNLSVALGHASGVGRGLKQAADGFAKFTSSINGRVLTKARDLTRLGLKPGKPVPSALPAYQIIQLGGEEENGEDEAVPVPRIVGPRAI